jgi:hypothetical protein
MAGTLKLKRSQYGESPTATDNFVIQQPDTPDGSLRISNGDIGSTTDVAEFDSAGNFKFNSGYGSVATAYACRAWCNFNGTGTVAIRASGNVTGITDNGTGDYTVNFTTAMPDADYCVMGTSSVDALAVTFIGIQTDTSLTTTSANIRVLDTSGFGRDRALINCSFVR